MRRGLSNAYGVYFVECFPFLNRSVNEIGRLIGPFQLACPHLESRQCQKRRIITKRSWNEIVSLWKGTTTPLARFSTDLYVRNVLFPNEFCECSPVLQWQAIIHWELAYPGKGMGNGDNHHDNSGHDHDQDHDNEGDDDDDDGNDNNDDDGGGDDDADGDADDDDDFTLHSLVVPADNTTQPWLNIVLELSSSPHCLLQWGWSPLRFFPEHSTHSLHAEWEIEPRETSLGNMVASTGRPTVWMSNEWEIWINLPYPWDENWFWCNLQVHDVIHYPALEIPCTPNKKTHTSD